MQRKALVLLVGVAALLPFSVTSFANCGAALCNINTQWEQQGVWSGEGWRFDARFDWIDQDQPMQGAEQVAVGEIPNHDDEVRTINRNTMYSLDYSSDQNWGLSIQLPVLNRDHLHTHHHQGEQESESWRYSEVGDIRLMGRYVIDPQSFGLIAGLKLPSGEIEVTNGEGDLAERTLQPGTGTTDALLGVYDHQPFEGSNYSWFWQGMVQIATNDHKGYRPGNSTTFDAGLRYALTQKLGLLAQANLLIKAQDKGIEAEPEESGGRYLFVSPGASYSIDQSMQLYGFLQLPVAQFVNGTQLTADYSFSAGVSVRF